ncbi:MAG: HEAT repeat domain-containing protein [Elusimicrobiota bacterium]|nr:MAG: HEAT repeat domain-containing protein [Elusimicrobiota bacterium]
MTIKPLAATLALGIAISPAGARASTDSHFAGSLSAVETLARQARSSAAANPPRVVHSREDVLRLTIASLGATTDEAAERIIASVGQLNITNDEYCKVIYKPVIAMVEHRDPAVRVRAVRAVGMIASIKSVPNAFVSPIGATLIPSLTDSEPKVRVEAARVLGTITQYTPNGLLNQENPIIANLIMAAAADQDAGVREAAAAALKSIKVAEAAAR